MALNGSWGTGKTTFVRMWQKYLEKSGYKTAYINAWEMDFTTNPLVSILGEVGSLTGKDNKAFKRIIKVFANIGFEYQPFQFETESEQIKEDNWIGRAWRCTNFIIRLEKLKGYANLCLIISPLAEQSAQTA